MRIVFLSSFLLACSGAEAPTTRATNEVEESARANNAEDPCPVLTASANSDMAGGVAPSVAGEDVVSNLEAFAAALPASAGGLTRTESSNWPRGAAGHWSPSVLAFYEEGDARVGVQIVDLVHVCSCEAGMGETLQSRAVTGGDVRTSVADHPATRGAGPPPELQVWVNDRCHVRVWAAPMNTLTQVASALDWAAISAACPAR